MRARSVSSEPNSSLSSSPFQEKSLTLILLDYDDTLMSSSWALQEAELTSVSNENEHGLLDIQEIFHFVSTKDAAVMGELELGSIQFLLSIITSEDSERVLLKIITNGDAAWLSQSLRSFLPLFEKYLEHHQIEIISARDRYEHRWPTRPEEWKAHCFRDEVMKVKNEYHKAMQHKHQQWRVSPTTRTTVEALSPPLPSTLEEQHDRGTDQGFSPVSDVTIQSFLTPPLSTLTGYQMKTSSANALEDKEIIHEVDFELPILLVSIGDGEYERNACHLVADELHLDSVSIKLQENPDPVLLIKELAMLQEALPRVMMKYWRHARSSGTSPLPPPSVTNAPQLKRLRARSQIDLQVSRCVPSGDLVLTNYSGLDEGHVSQGGSTNTEEEEDSVEYTAIGSDDGTSEKGISQYFSDRPMSNIGEKRKREETVVNFKHVMTNNYAEEQEEKESNDASMQWKMLNQNGVEEDMEDAFNIFQDVDIGGLSKGARSDYERIHFKRI